MATKGEPEATASAGGVPAGATEAVLPRSDAGAQWQIRAGSGWLAARLRGGLHARRGPTQEAAGVHLGWPYGSSAGWRDAGAEARSAVDSSGSL